MTSTKAPPPPLTADQMKELLRLSSRGKPLSEGSKKLQKIVDGRADYIWREMASMAGLNIEWWDYNDDLFMIIETHSFMKPTDCISIECEISHKATPSPIQVAMRWIIEEGDLKASYLSMTDEEWKADFIKEANQLAAWDAEERRKAAAKQKKQNDLRNQALAKIRAVLTPEEMRALGLDAK